MEQRLRKTIFLVVLSRLAIICCVIFPFLVSAGPPPSSIPPADNTVIGPAGGPLPPTDYLGTEFGTISGSDQNDSGFRNATNEQAALTAIDSYSAAGGSGTGGDTAEPVTISSPDGFLGWLHAFIIFIGGTFVLWGASLFSGSIINFVVGFGFIYAEWGIGYAVEIIWQILRDVFNIALIFGIIYIGLRLIFDANDSGAKTSLINLILAALLINFSLFIVKFVIDAANSLASLIFTAGLGGGSTNPDVGLAYLNIIGISNILNFDDFTMPAGTTFGVLFLMLAFLLVTGFVLFAGGILMMVRAIALIFFLIFSPILFIGWVLPMFKKYSSQYWSKLMGYAFMGPAYLFCIYISFTILNAFKFQFQDSSMINALQQEGGSDMLVASIITYVVAIIFMIMSLIVAKQMGVAGAATAISIGNGITKRVRSSTSNAVRGTGRAATYPARWVAQEATSRTGKRLSRGIENLQTKDNVFGKLARTNTFTRTAENTTKAMKDAKFGLTRTTGEEAAYREKTETRFQDVQNIRGITRLEELRAKVKNGAALSTNETTELAGLEAKESQMRSSVTGMTTEQFEKLTQKEREEIAPFLTNAQSDKFLESKELDSSDKAAIVKARQDAIRKNVENGTDIFTAELVKLTVEQLETMGDEFIKKNAHLLSNSQMDDIKKSKKFNEAQKNSFTSERKTGQAALLNSDPSKIFNQKDSTGKISSRKAAEMAQLGPDILTDPKSLNYLNVDILEAIIDKKALNPADRTKIKNMLNNPPTGLPNQVLKEIIVMRNWFKTPLGSRF